MNTKDAIFTRQTSWFVMCVGWSLPPLVVYEIILLSIKMKSLNTNVKSVGKYLDGKIC